MDLCEVGGRCQDIRVQFPQKQYAVRFVVSLTVGVRSTWQNLMLGREMEALLTHCAFPFPWSYHVAPQLQHSLQPLSPNQPSTRCLVSRIEDCRREISCLYIVLGTSRSRFSRFAQLQGFGIECSRVPWEPEVSELYSQNLFSPGTFQLLAPELAVFPHDI